MAGTGSDSNGDDLAVDGPVTWSAEPIYAVWDVDGTVRQASASYAALVGLTLDEIIGRRWPELVPGEADLSWRQLRFSVTALQTEPLLVVDMPTQATGESLWFRWTEWAIRDEHGQLVQVHSTAIDVTELHEARAAIAASLDAVVDAHARGRREVLDRLHDGAVQQLTAARWAVDAGDLPNASALIREAVGAVLASMDSLEPIRQPATLRRPPADPFWRQMLASSRARELPPQLRESVVAAVADAVALVSATGSVWLEPGARLGMFDDRADVDIPMLLSAVHPDDRGPVATGIVQALSGDDVRVHWRFRHPEAGWRHLCSWLTPLPERADEPRVAVALTMDITDDDRNTVNDVMAAQVAERERIARDLHDDVLQQMAGLRWMLQAGASPADAVAELDAVEGALRARLAEMHTPVARFGLERSLLHLLDETRTPTQLLMSTADPVVPAGVADVVWRCAREGLRNVDRHAQAVSAVVDVTVDEHSVVLRVTDDGVGIDQQAMLAAGRQGHLGVVAMRDAVGALGGRLELRRHHAGGTMLRVELPLRPG